MTQDPMYVEPGAWLAAQEEERLTQIYIAELQDKISRLEIQLGREANALQRRQLQWQIQQARQDLKLRRQELAERRRVTELGLATSPIDFVAYEMYKRGLEKTGQRQQAKYEAAAATQQQSVEQAKQAFRSQLAILQDRLAEYGDRPHHPGARALREQISQLRARYRGTQRRMGRWRNPQERGWGPVGTPRTDAQIQAMVQEMVGEGGGRLGKGAFGVDVPMTQAISRQEGRALSQDEMAILSSFLRAGFKAGGKQVSYDPEEYWKEVEEGWVPTFKGPEVTQYAY